MRATTPLLLLLSALMCVAACSSDVVSPEEPWGVDDPSNDPSTEEPVEEPAPPTADERYPERPAEIFACHEDFLLGPVWKAVRDQQAAVRESHWIARLYTSRFDHYDPATPSADDVPLYEEEFATLKALFEAHDITLIDEEFRYDLIVSGRPLDILNVVKTSCLIRAFDLTGFQCDCAPEQCELARSCRLDFSGTILHPADGPYVQNPPILSFRNGHIAPLAGCIKYDGITNWTSATATCQDSRGVRWSSFDECPAEWKQACTTTW